MIASFFFLGGGGGGGGGRQTVDSAILLVSANSRATHVPRWTQKAQLEEHTLRAEEVRERETKKVRKPRGLKNAQPKSPLSQVVGVSCDVVEEGARRPPVLVRQRFVHALLGLVSGGDGVPPAACGGWTSRKGGLTDFVARTSATIV